MRYLQIAKSVSYNQSFRVRYNMRELGRQLVEDCEFTSRNITLGNRTHTLYNYKWQHTKVLKWRSCSLINIIIVFESKANLFIIQTPQILLVRHLLRTNYLVPTRTLP